MSYAEVMAGYLQGCRSRRDSPGAVRGLLVGQAAPVPKPGTRHVPLFPFPRNCAGERLHRMSGVDLDTYFSTWDTVNTVAWFPGRASSGKGDAFPAALAREQAALRMEEFGMAHRVCIFVGKSNAAAYPWAGGLPAPLTFHGNWAWLPHTSGIVAFWNDPANRDAARELFRQASEKILDLTKMRA